MEHTLDTARITAESRQAVQELLAAAGLRAGDIFVIGCSSSEIVGGHIGKDSSMEAAAAVLAGVAPVLAEKGVSLAAQCCGHLLLPRSAAAGRSDSTSGPPPESPAPPGAPPRQAFHSPKSHRTQG